jgi:hypothetical protein
VEKMSNFYFTRIVVVSGPSGVGKGPIIENALKLSKTPQVKVRKTKTERHSGREDDIGFEGFEGDYVEINCRGSMQRLYVNEVHKTVADYDLCGPARVVLIEAYHTALEPIMEKFTAPSRVEVTPVFISPLTSHELRELENNEDFENYVPDLMLGALVRRAEKEGKAFTRKLVHELEERALDSVNELRRAHKYWHVIPNHCYECDSRWGLSPLVGEPQNVVDSLVNIIQYGSDSLLADKGKLYAFLRK